MRVNRVSLDVRLLGEGEKSVMDADIPVALVCGWRFGSVLHDSVEAT